MERLWNDIEKGKPNDSERNLWKCYYIHQKSYKDGPVIKTEYPW
jgi:hypothetical protein